MRDEEIPRRARDWIGVISGTHGLARLEAIAALRACKPDYSDCFEPIAPFPSATSAMSVRVV